MSFDIKPGRGSERVKAWVYTILNPVIDSLRREVELLKAGNLSWRVHSRRCEYIRPITELIDANHQPNLEDFLAEHPTIGDRFAKHDSALASVERSVTEYVQGLLNAFDFQERVSKCIDDYESRLRLSNPTCPDLRDLPGRVADYVAEFLANNSRSLPRHYTMHVFWKAYSGEFQDYFSGFSETIHYNVRGKTQDLLSLAEQLRIDLESLRLTLVREYDIPAAPIQPPNNNYQENAFSRFK